ncbi:hypothetical protein DU19_0187 [Chlamydia muridarum]|uniref:Uncharacterized protein n=1 Tax=Chlamydia muridarum (strain MoPn / Nigg) TaxID=243161 RepID=Q9PLD9_CHLMU|nr:hypothetical protein TC_0165 [Chlamydia muridarum str. Nigg]AHH22558.1 hypothetical protein TAC_00880 [Chlamydia muridarum str. Nigg3 CMUT3-5]AHH23482.1 hypothetical protein Y015_00880 [Chlamydia muridarum str. Nigg CM972]KDU80459.1 hypothetical protein DU17_0187 [Chlamydia muridarum]KDU81159.1 hypothetical protein DU18_0188 [Chlamydia muridarum]
MAPSKTLRKPLLKRLFEHFSCIFFFLLKANKDSIVWEQHPPSPFFLILEYSLFPK